MAEEKNTSNQKSSKKTNWCLWLGCGCLGLIIIIGVAIYMLTAFTDFSLGGLVGESTKKQDPEDREMTKAELVNYFVDLTTYWGDGKTKINLIKWDKPVVTISPADTPTENGIQIMDEFITMFNSNSTTTKLERVESGGDIKVYFTPAGPEVAGRAGPSSGVDHIIDSAYIKFGDNVTVFKQSESQVFAHEMMHALGFAGHYKGETCRLTSASTCGSHLTKNEERLIQMLYGTNISDNLDEGQIRSFFENWNPK